MDHPLLYFPGIDDNVNPGVMASDGYKIVQAVAQAAHKAGIYNNEVPLNGPQLLMLLDDMANELVRLNNGSAVREADDKKYSEQWFENFMYMYDGWFQNGEDILNGGLISLMDMNAAGTFKMIGQLRIPPLQPTPGLNLEKGVWSAIQIDSSKNETVYQINGIPVKALPYSCDALAENAVGEFMGSKITTLGKKTR